MNRRDVERIAKWAGGISLALSILLWLDKQR
jgi:hypothetical protein